jgi:hypothetical protein
LPLGLLLLPLFAAARPAAAAEVEVEAGFTAPVVGVDETVGFWIEVRSGFLRAPRFEPELELDNLEILGQPSRSESFRFVNGTSARSLRLTWVVRPLAPGPAAVRSIRVVLGGQTLDLPSERLEVVEEPTVHRTRPVGPRPRDPFRRFRAPMEERRPARRSLEVFLDAAVTPEHPFAGQQAVYTLYLYTQADISAIQPRQVPAFEGFWAHEVPLPEEQVPEMVEVHGQRFRRVALLQRVLFARRPGRIEIEPAEFDLVARTRDSGRLGAPLALPQQLARRSNPLTVEVRELPPPPEAFRGAVGSFVLASRLEPARLAVGEAATLTVTLSGDGHVQSLPAPQAPEVPGVTVYPPEETSHEHIGIDRVTGERTWKWVLVPRQAGTWRLPTFQVPFYDPAVEAYRVAASAPLTLRALPAAQRAEEEDRPLELNPIRSAAVPVGGSGVWERLLPWLFLVPFAAALALTLARRFDLGRGGHSRAAAQRLLARLEALEGPKTSGETSDQVGNRLLAARVETAWSGYLHERWDLPPDVPATRWSDAVAEHPAAGPAAAEALGRLAEEIHYLRYAPQLSTATTLRRELLEHSRSLARRLP